MNRMNQFTFDSKSTIRRSRKKADAKSRGDVRRGKFCVNVKLHSEVNKKRVCSRGRGPVRSSPAIAAEVAARSLHHFAASRIFLIGVPILFTMPAFT